MDEPKRTLAKAVSWQINGFLAMLVIGYLFTGSLSAGGGLAAVTTVAGFVNYVLHERVWARVAWGRRDPGR